MTTFNFSLESNLKFLNLTPLFHYLNLKFNQIVFFIQFIHHQVFTIDH